MMNDTKLVQELLAGARELAGSRPPRGVPSPSSVMRCTRENWYTARRQPVDNHPDNGESYVSAESGGATESVLRDVIKAAGLGVVLEANRELTQGEAAALSMAGGQCDAVVERPDGTLVVVELKRKGVFDIIQLLRNGLLEEEPNEYVQLQCYMHALRIHTGLYIAWNWDRAMFTRQVKFAKDFKDLPRPDAVYAQWVEYSEPTVKAAIKRAEIQRRFIERSQIAARVPRDYDPANGQFPCSWCAYKHACLKAG